MTKQEEIREGVTILIEEETTFIEGEYSPLAGPITSDTRELDCEPSYLASKILSYLHSQGVVIKVERELPIKIAGQENISYCAGYHDACHQRLKAGYVAVEPLVKDE